MATCSSILAWRILWTGEPGGLQSRGCQRVRHNWVTKHTHTHQEFVRVYYYFFLDSPVQHKCSRSFWLEELVSCGDFSSRSSAQLHGAVLTCGGRWASKRSHLWKKMLCVCPSHWPRKGAFTQDCTKIVQGSVLWSIGSQRVRHDWATELNWPERYLSVFCLADIPQLTSLCS